MGTDIPEKMVVCPNCVNGRILVGDTGGPSWYGDTSQYYDIDTGIYETCDTCSGTGYIPQEWIDHPEAKDKYFRQREIFLRAKAVEEEAKNRLRNEYIQQYPPSNANKQQSLFSQIAVVGLVFSFILLFVNLGLLILTLFVSIIAIYIWNKIDIAESKRFSEYMDGYTAYFEENKKKYGIGS